MNYVWVLMRSYDHEGSDLIAVCETEKLVDRAFDQYVKYLDLDSPRYGWKDISVNQSGYDKAVYSDTMCQTIHYFKVPLNKIRKFACLNTYDDIES